VALRANTAASVAITIFTQPVFGLLIGWVWLDERPGAPQFAGTAVVLSAVAFALFPRRGRRPPSQLVPEQSGGAANAGKRASRECSTGPSQRPTQKHSQENERRM
jgi:hypothetical protein